MGTGGAAGGTGEVADVTGAGDTVIATMLQTGRDMRDKYKRTSKGGLEVSVVMAIGSGVGDAIDEAPRPGCSAPVERDSI